MLVRNVILLLGLTVTLTLTPVLVGGAAANQPDPTKLPELTPGSTYEVPETPKYNYVEALHKSFIFYHAQISGKIEGTGNQRLAWRGDSCLTCKGKFGEDLSGGFYEAANIMHVGLPNAWTTTQLAWNLVEFGSAMDKVNELVENRLILRWAADFLIASHPQENTFVGQLGSSDSDWEYFGPPEFYHIYGEPVKRVLYVNETHPATEIVCEAAAALAATSIVFRDIDPDYADLCLTHATQLYLLGTKYNGSMMSLKDPMWSQAQSTFPSTGILDEMAWSAAWLYRATGTQSYLDAARTWYPNEIGWAYDWDSKIPALHVLMAGLTNGRESVYTWNAKWYFDRMLPGSMRTVPHTPKGLMMRNYWGSLGYASNAAWLAFVYRRMTFVPIARKQELFAWAISQVNYALGDGGRSLVVGFGDLPPTHPFHKSSYNSILAWPTRSKIWQLQQDDFLLNTAPNRHIAYGAIVGGPDKDDVYIDARESYHYGEVSIANNAAWTGCLAALISEYGGSAYSDCGLDLGWSYTGAGTQPTYASDDCYHTCAACAVPEVPYVGDDLPVAADSGANSIGATFGTSALAIIVATLAVALSRPCALR